MSPVKTKKTSSIPFSGETPSSRPGKEIALHHKLEKTITDIVELFTDINASEINLVINKSLRIIGECTRADRSYIFLAYDNLTKASCVYQWCAKGIKSDIKDFQGISVDILPWVAGKLKNLEVVHIPDVSNLPPEAAAEKKIFDKHRTKSIVCIPLAYCGNLIGCLGLDTVRKARTWNKEVIELLKLVGEILGGALEQRIIEQKLRTNERFLSNVFSSIQDGISILDKEMNIVQVNPTMERWYKHNMPLVGKKCYAAYHCRSEPCEVCPTQKTLKTGSPAYEIVPMTAEGGKIIGWISLYAFPHIDTATGELKGVIEYVRDITAQKQAEVLLENEHKQLLSVFESIEYPVYVSDPNTYEVLYANQVVIKDMGNVVGDKCYRAFQGLDSPCAFCTNKFIFNGYGDKPYIWEFQNKRNRRWYRCFDRAINWPDGRKVRFEVAFDITERRNSEEELKKVNKELTDTNKRLRQLAVRDCHTGLYNQRYLEEAIEAEYHRARRYGYQFSVIMMDIDYFKSINNVYGYKFGNLVLRQFARQIKSLVRPYDIAIRFSGEEFVIVSPGADRQVSLAMAQRILDAINLYNFGNRKQSIKLKLSVAVSSYPEDRITKGMDLIELCDWLLNKAKDSGGNRIFSSLDIKDGRDLEIPNINMENPEVRSLKVKIEKLTKRANQGLIESIFAFAKTIEAKDRHTGAHAERTVFYATQIAKELKLSRDEIELVRQASVLHDLGKIGISENILLKKSKLTKCEFEKIKKHPQIGADIIRPIHFFHSIIPLILHHHERWDGRGYPFGLKGEDVCMGARIIAIADVYQALISDRPYRRAFTKVRAIEIIKKGSGTQFDPHIVTVLLNILQKEN